MNIVIFSGGFDSTLVLDRVAREIDKTGERILVISVVPSYSPEKSNREKKSRTDILQYLKKKYPEVDFETCGLTIDYEYRGVRPGAHRCLVQPITWLDSLVQSSMFNIRDDESIKIHLSYINGDDALSHKEDICNIIKSSFNIMFKKPVPNIDILFPLQYTRKNQVLEMLMIDDIELYEKATTCENHWDSSDNCGKCTPCLHLKEALFQLSISGSTDEVRRYAKEDLQKRFKEIITVVKAIDDETTINLHDDKKDKKIEEYPSTKASEIEFNSDSKSIEASDDDGNLIIKIPSGQIGATRSVTIDLRPASDE